jgi:hypothetical protein
MAFKMRSGNNSNFKMMGSSTPDSKPVESVADPKEFARQQKLHEGLFDPRVKRDSTVENVVEFFDPTGISSWDDAIEAYNKKDKGVMDYVDMFGAVPLLGKVGKIARAAGKGFDLYKSASRTASATIGSAANRLLNLGDAASDIKEDNTK